MKKIRGSFIIMGDFNCIVDCNESHNGSMFRDGDGETLRMFIWENDLFNPDQSGCFFTWNNRASDQDLRIWKKLDRVMSNEDWRISFPQSSISFRPLVYPITVRLSPLYGRKLRSVVVLDIVTFGRS